MLRISKADKQTIIRRIVQGKIDAAMLSTSNLIDEIVLSMHNNGILQCIGKGFKDKRASNTVIPFYLTFALAIAAKMKVHTSLTDIPFALHDHRTICELGYSLYDDDKEIGKGLMNEGTLRHLIGMYSSNEFITGYNSVVQDHIIPLLSIEPDIHILDCTKLEVNIKNENYENCGVVSDNDGVKRGYKLASLRGIVDDSGIIEDIRFGPINVHDMELSRDMLINSPVLKPNDIIINDRGFLSRDMINLLKTKRNVDTYVPLKRNMDAYKTAVSIAHEENQWSKHPNRKRTNQVISFIPNLGSLWQSEHPKHDVEINSCVVWDKIINEHFVFITTDLSKSAAQIIMTYELRPEIEEDYRQLKDFWKIEDFKSTKLNIISFHIVCVLFGYLFFQLFSMMPEGEEYSGKSLPVILKNYRPQANNTIVIYSGDLFGVFSLLEIAQLYSKCDVKTQLLLSNILKPI